MLPTSTHCLPVERQRRTNLRDARATLDFSPLTAFAGHWICLMALSKAERTGADVLIYGCILLIPTFVPVAIVTTRLEC
ncbi:hypothetical protein QFZ97_007935 [Paraburkholderia youngii]